MHVKSLGLMIVNSSRVCNVARAVAWNGRRRYTVPGPRSIFNSKHAVPRPPESKPTPMSMYTQLAEIPSPTGAQFLPHTDGNPTTIQVTYSVRNHVKNVKRTMSKTIFVPDERATPVPGPLLDTDVIAQVVSPSGAKRAIWRKAEKDTFVEVWTGEGEGGTRLAHQWLVTDVHGDVYADEYLSSFAFSPSERSLVYVAEEKTPETSDPFAKFRFMPDFGEGLTGKRRPGIFMLHCEEGSQSVPTLVRPATNGASNTIHFGQPVFSATADDVLYATAYEFTVDGRFLGIKGCFNRPSGIWQLRLEGSAQKETDNQTEAKDTKKKPTEITAPCTKFTPSHLSCRSPRTLAHNGRSTLFWLACRSGGAHVATSTIHALDITHERGLSPATEKKELVGIVDVPSPNVHAGFPGLYPDYNLASAPFVLTPGPKGSDAGVAPSVLIASAWGSRKTILRVDIATGAVVDLTPSGSGPNTGTDAELYSWSLLGTDGRRRVLCSRSSPAVPYEVLLGVVQDSGSVVWRVVDRPSLTKAVANALGSVKTLILPIPGRGLVETILIQSSNRTSQGSDSKPPCITSPHGGPHGTSLTTFTPLSTALVLDGYTLSLPNYTGSPGYGEVFLQGLVGKCGDLDIEDTVASAGHLIEQGIAQEGPGQQFIMGGSHGGFVTAHLIGKYTEFFSAAILRNPVISAGDISNTDIPDWYFSEFGEGYPIRSSKANITFSSENESPENDNSDIPPLVSADMFSRLQAMSPIAAVDAIKIPVLLLIGAADRRVAPSQGVAFYHALKARYSASGSVDESGTESGSSKLEMLVFEGEGHPIEGVEASEACAEASARWFAQARELST